MKCDVETRFACAALSVFQLNDAGKPHLLAIVIGYNESIENAVASFNKGLDQEPSNPEATDWPCHYSKLCAQVSD